MNRECEHETGLWKRTKELDTWTGEMEYKDEFVVKSACVDIDTHRYKCTLCGKVMYYSGRARDFYEKGIKSDVTGLQ